MSIELGKYLQTEYNRLYRYNDVDGVAKLKGFGFMYQKLNAIEKSLQDIKIHGNRYLAMIEIVKDWDFGSPSPTFMEVGCNTGFLSIFLKQMYKESRVIGIDVSKKQIDVNVTIDSAVYKSGVEFSCCDGKNLSSLYEANSVDVVFLCEILEHIEYMSPDQLGVLKSSVDVIKPGGKVIVTVPYEDRIPSTGHKTEFNLEKLLNLLHTQPYTIENLDLAREKYNLNKHFVFLLSK